MPKQKNKVAKLMGAGFVLLGSAVLIRPVQFGSLLGIDGKKRPGLILILILALRDVLSGFYILRARDNRTLRRSLFIRILCDTSDFLMSVFGRGIIIQPKARRVAPGILPVIAALFFVRSRIKD